MADIREVLQQYSTAQVRAVSYRKAIHCDL